ncbi:BCAS3 microtubule associated cell migration factor-like protein [Lates japonicus]|uniref:BCAS3 microtubule associated cell migration factor-like protein n=1 Tax=Lates japonicus TaxID=270547 RepID=A0AAD3MEF4_LATJO|nr:BCAS3 microtubule associated cell migration factor-like protein [Lates japonicus]
MALRPLNSFAFPQFQPLTSDLQAITPGGGGEWFMALVGYGHWWEEKEEEVGLQISDSHQKLSVATQGPSGVSQHGHLGLVDV